MVNIYEAVGFNILSFFLWVGNEPYMQPDAFTLQVLPDLYHIFMCSDDLQNILRKILLTMHNIQRVSYEHILPI